MTVRRLGLAAAVSVAIFVGGCSDPEGEANALYVAASKDVSQAEGSESPGARYDLLLAADQKIDKIIDRYPKTAAALKVAANDRIGPLSRSQIIDAIKVSANTPSVCIRNPTPQCVINGLFGIIGELNDDHMLKMQVITATYVIARRIDDHEALRKLDDLDRALRKAGNLPPGTGRIPLDITLPYLASVAVSSPDRLPIRVKQISDIGLLEQRDIVPVALKLMKFGSNLSQEKFESFLSLTQGPYFDRSKGFPGHILQMDDALDASQKATIGRRILQSAINFGFIKYSDREYFTYADKDMAAAILESADAQTLPVSDLREMKAAAADDIKRFAEQAPLDKKVAAWLWYQDKVGSPLPADFLVPRIGNDPRLLAQLSMDRLKQDPPGAALLARALAAAVPPTSRKSDYSWMVDVISRLAESGVNSESLAYVKSKLVTQELSLSDIDLYRLSADFPDAVTSQWLMSLYLDWLPRAYPSAASLWLGSFAYREGRSPKMSDAQLSQLVKGLCPIARSVDFNAFFAGLLVRRNLVAEAKHYASCFPGLGNSEAGSMQVALLALEGDLDAAANLGAKLAEGGSLNGIGNYLDETKTNEVLRLVMRRFPLMLALYDGMPYITAPFAIEKAYQDAMKSSGPKPIGFSLYGMYLLSRYIVSGEKQKIGRLFADFPDPEIRAMSGLVYGLWLIDDRN